MDPGKESGTREIGPLVFPAAKRGTTRINRSSETLPVKNDIDVVFGFSPGESLERSFDLREPGRLNSGRQKESSGILVCPGPKDGLSFWPKMTVSIEELKKRVAKASEKLADFTRTPKRMAHWKRRQSKGGKANKGKPKSAKQRKSMREAALKRHAKKREEKAKDGPAQA